MRRLAFVAALTLSAPLTGCETISQVVGAFTAAKDVAQHLEKDIKAELTNERVDKVLTVIPSLEKFSEEAKVKWKPDPAAHDFSKLTNSIAGLNDYIAFFESHDTRITQFYADVMKIHDARAQILLAEGMDKAEAKFEEQEEAIEEKLETAEEEAKAELERQLDQVQRARERMEESKKQAEEHRKQMQKANEKSGYKVTDAEIELVRSRLDEVNRVFSEHGYAEGNQEAAERASPNSAGDGDEMAADQTQ